MDKPLCHGKRRATLPLPTNIGSVWIFGGQQEVSEASISHFRQHNNDYNVVLQQSQNRNPEIALRRLHRILSQNETLRVVVAFDERGVDVVT